MQRKIKNLLVLGALALILAGCSSAGPYVTNISSDGNGNIIVEKNMVKYNGWTGSVSAGDHPTTTTIKMGSKKEDKVDKP